MSPGRPNERVQTCPVLEQDWACQASEQGGRTLRAHLKLKAAISNFSCLYSICPMPYLLQAQHILSSDLYKEHACLTFRSRLAMMQDRVQAMVHGGKEYDQELS